VAASGAMGPGRRGEGDGVVASEGFHMEEEESKGGDGEQRTLRASRRRGVGWGSGSWPREGRWMGVSQFDTVGRLWAALSKVAARGHDGSGMVNSGGRRGTRDAERRGVSG
jgi:hypothetical protein